MVQIASLSLTGRSSYPVTPSESVHELLVMATLQAAEKEEDDASRAPVDVMIVLDHSGSMAGEKLALCIKTLNFLITGVLAGNDKLGLVIFDTDVTMRMNQENKEKALARIAAIAAGSSTNLSGGLFSGIEQMLAAGTSKVSAILCLTDGLMNHGITDKPKLFSLLKAQLGAFPEGRTRPPVYCFGFGSDCDQDCLSSIASQTGGNFYSVLDLDGVSLAFADVLGGVMATTCQDIKLTCEVKLPATFAADAMTKFPQKRQSPAVIEVTIKDLFAGEKRDVLFKLNVPKGGGASTVVVFDVNYLDVALERRASAHAELVVARCPGSALPAGSVMDLDVGRNLARIQAVEEMARAKELASHGNYEDGRRVMREAVAKTRAMMSDLHVAEDEDAMMREMVQDLSSVESNMVSAEQWHSKGASTTAQYMDGQSNQRSNKLYNMSAMEAQSASLAMAAPTSVYQTKSANTFMKKAASVFLKP